MRGELSTGADIGAAVPLGAVTRSRSPRLRQEFVERPALLDRLREGRDRTLTLVCAPAGYGKSVLLAQWATADRETTSFVWLSLDASDSDPVRLWTSLVSGLHEAYPPAGVGALSALTAGPRAISETVMPRLVQELADAPPLVVILDDWHLVRNPLCDTTIATFIERTPDAVQVVISARADPALPLARLRTRGELVEIRERSLRVTDDQALELFQRADAKLERSDVERINVRTEGWLAGICMAILVVKERADRTGFAHEFLGESRHVLDFLARDVLDAAPADLREFLLRTSVLGRLSAPLCDAVLETSTSAAMLEEISRTNLFLVSLDDVGAEYRYHHLFAAMLERELRAADPSAPAGLHARASAWLDAHGDIDGSVEHAIASGDVARSRELVMRHAQRYWATGRLATVVRWLDALSWPEALEDRQLAVIRAGAAGQSGSPRDEIEQWLEIAESGPDLEALATGFASLRSAVALLRAAYLTRGLDVAVVEARLALEVESSSSPWRGPLLSMLGQSLYLLGRSDEARPLLDEVHTLPGAREQAPATALGMAYLALILLEKGDRAESERIGRSALQLLADRHLSSGVVAAIPNVALGCVLLQGADARAAIAHLERAVELAATAAPSYWHVHALLRLADAYHRLGDTADATASLTTARLDLDALPDAGILGSLYKAVAVELRVRPRREGFLGDEVSEAELRVLRVLLSGASLADASRELFLSPNTVKTHRRSIYRKLGVSTRDELLAHTATLGVTELSALDSRDP